MTMIPRRDFIQAAGLGLIAPQFLAGSAPVRAARAGRRIRIGQIGTGHAHAAGKMETLRKLGEDFEVAGIAEPDPQARAAAQHVAAYRGLRWMSEDELLGTKGLEAVAVETDVRDLVPAAVRCVSAGLHVHLDKAPGESLAAFKALLDEARRRRLAVQMGYMLRYNPAFQFCFKAVRQGWLGQIFEVDAVMSKAADAAGRRKPAQYAGGSMFEIGCHLIDALVLALGRPERIAAYSRKMHPDRDPLADNMLAVFEYPGAVATVRSTLVEVQGERRRQFVVCGEEGTIEIRPLEPPRLALTLARARDGFKKGFQEVTLPAMPGRYDEQLLDFARVIRGEKAADVSYDHDLAVHECVLRASGVALG